MLKLIDLLERNNGCCTRPKSPLLTEGVNKQLLSENMQYHIDNKLPLTENTFRYGSRAFIDLWNEARDLHNAGIIKLDGDDKQIVEETDLGQVIYQDGTSLPLTTQLGATELKIPPSYQAGTSLSFDVNTGIIGTAGELTQLNQSARLVSSQTMSVMFA